jgi:branched-chain amino acid aminotransferase
MEIEERALSVDEIFTTIEHGRMTEAFGTGTAAVVSPVGQFTYHHRPSRCGDGR